MDTPNVAPRACADAATDDVSVRLRKPPKLVKNKNGARVRLNGRDFYCGVWGSKEATQRYRELVAEWTRNGCRLPPLLEDGDPDGATVDEVIALYCAHELPVRPASMQARIKLGLRPLRESFGSKPANEFRALDLVALRTEFVKSGRLSRGMVNQSVALIRGVFAWGASVGRVDERVPFRLASVKGLRRGQGAREGRMVQPIDWPTVEATLRHASEPVRGLILFQWFTGARPGEACATTAEDIDRTGKVWIYVPKHHKTEHHGKTRRISIGPVLQGELLPLLVRRPSTLPLFSPEEAIEEQKTVAAKKRRTRVQPSQVFRARRRAARPQREVAEGYDVNAYRRAIERAVDAANADVKRDQLRQALSLLPTEEKARTRIVDAIDRLPVFVKRHSRARLVRRVGEALRADESRLAELAKIISEVLDAPGKFQRWHPHRLRHAFAQRAERETGDLDAVRACLGHATLTMAARYAHPDDRKARELAERIG